VTDEGWPRVKALFQAAVERPTEERDAFLAAATGDDAALRREVESLLTSDTSGVSFLDRLPVASELVLADALTAPPASLDHSLSHAVLTPGLRVGPYEIVAPLGAGSMGEVYRAHDTKLGRDVAIKVLPAAFTADPERLARFDVEARMLAALNHPHIGSIYGLEDAGGVPALVLELVEGETVADRLQRGPLAANDAFGVARQIADALDAAHQKGIVHRDLKPANIKITPAGVVKVLDFGLAKAAVGEPALARELSQSPKVGMSGTRVGVILGTATYMSPEQARGMPVDKRADVWAFGCVMYETLTGRPPFTGQTIAETFAAILEQEPDWKALPRVTPASIRALLKQCLEKDPTRRLQNIADARSTIEQAQRGWKPWQVAAGAATAVAALAIGAGVWWRAPAGPAARSEWVQLTQFPDSVIQPALSPDGRMVAFLRAASSPLVPFANGEVYVKMLPDGEPLQLTNDSLRKMSPVFSPDGARIAYGTVEAPFTWDTWIVSVRGGEPQRWLRNASGVIWAGPRQLLFSEIRKSPQMVVVAADEGRSGQRDVYVPAHEQGMAHLSYLSPDRRSVLLVEMDENHAWTPCRVVPLDGSGPGRLIGPPGAACTFGAWSRDGKWIYFTSNAGGTNHIWRQRLPDGEPEQITLGPTEEEGIALAPDGRSLVTAVALSSTSLWLHDGSGERQISVEGNAVDAKFTPDGKTLLYKVVNSLGTYPLPGELRVANLETGRSEVMLPGFQVIDYDVSADGQHVVMEAADGDGTLRLWLARLDGSVPRGQIPNVEGRQPRFAPDGDILFRRSDGAATFVYRVRPDGTGMRKAIEQAIPLLGDVSPDGRFIGGWTTLPGSESSMAQLFPLNGGAPLPVAAFISWSRSSSGGTVSFSIGTIADGRSYVVPLRPGEMLPPMPAAGLRSEDDVARLPGARRVDALTVPGPSPDVYAFHRTTTQRNLYRIPLR
jgi:Tol biopolymer transport system component